MKVIIAGGRDFDNYALLKQHCDYYLRNAPEIVIVSGGAKGADALGEQYARENNLPLEIFPADWDAHGKLAGPIRNKHMAEYADALIAFWDGKSSGTGNMIANANIHQLKIRIVNYTT